MSSFGSRICCVRPGEVSGDLLRPSVRHRRIENGYHSAMTLIVPENFAAVIQSLTWAGDAEPMAVTYGVEIDPASPPADVSTLATDLRGAFTAEMLPVLDGIISMLQTEVSWQQSAPPTPPLIGVASGGGSGAGTTGSVLPQNTAFLVHKRTPVGGRGGRGRLYFPGVDESVCSDLGVLTSAWQTTFNAALSDWLIAVNAIAGVIGMCLFHDSGGIFAPSDPFPITSLTLDPSVATQRRRLRR